MTPDDYKDFVSWKKGLNSTGAYNRWKHNNKISGYDEKVLIKIYALERQIERLEAIVYTALED